MKRIRLWEPRSRIRQRILERLKYEALTPREMRWRFLRTVLGPSYGTIYAVLDDLENEGLVTSELEPGGPARDGRPQRRYRAR